MCCVSKSCISTNYENAFEKSYNQIKIVTVLNILCCFLYFSVTRLMGFIREGMSGKKMTSLRVPKGCSAIQQDLAQVFGNFLRLTSHNRSVFGEYYASIIERLMKGKADELSPREYDSQASSTSKQHQSPPSNQL